MRYILFCFIVAVMVGCAAPSVVLDQNYQRANANKLNAGDGCRYLIVDITDQRKDKQSLGSLGYTQVSSVDFVQWLGNGLAAAGFTTSPSDPEDQKTVRIAIELKLAHIKSSSTSMAANLVIAVRLDGDARTALLRGRTCTINWASGQGEIKAAFDAALEHLTSQLIALTQGYCKDCLATHEAGRI